MRILPDFAYEDRQGAMVCGVDEVGRGPWAGPVVAAAVVLPRQRVPAGIDDSKRVPPAVREKIFRALFELAATGKAAIGVGAASVAEIDELNILGATMLAMRRAVLALPSPPGHALIDGNRRPDLPCRSTAIIGGDGISLSIAAASIVAKVTRDRMMLELAARHPGYGWERNKGYGTAQHAAALLALGITRHHRLSFAPVARAGERQEIRDNFVSL
jgi:ribonuclease HII